MELVLCDAPSASDREAIVRPLVAFNDERFGPSDIRPLAVLIRRDEATLGGLWGRTTYGWLYVELLTVPEALRGRGLGAKLLARAEAEAIARGARGAWVDTFGERNRRFYERAGYAVFGSIPDQPPGDERFFLKKTLRPA